MDPIFRVILVDMKTGYKLYWTGASISEDPAEAWSGPHVSAEKEARDAQNFGLTEYDYQYKVSLESAGI